MDIKIAVVDDNRTDRENLIKDLEVFSSVVPSANFIVEQFESGNSFLDVYSSGKYQLVFFDIQMEGLNGIESANRLRLVDTDTLIVFCSTSREYAFDAFPIHPFDYLVKPYSQERINTVLSEMIRVVSQEEPSIEVKIPRDMVKVELRSIVAVSSRGHNVDIFMENSKPLVSTMRFSELEEQLLVDPRFLSCNRGIIINMDHVLSLDDDIFRMKDGSIYPLRVRERSRIVSNYTKYMLSRVSGGKK